MIIRCDARFHAAYIKYVHENKSEALLDTCREIATLFYSRRIYAQNNIKMVYIARCTLHPLIFNGEEYDTGNTKLINEDEYIVAKVMET
jgi:hypothetical protein